MPDPQSFQLHLPLPLPLIGLVVDLYNVLVGVIGLPHNLDIRTLSKGRNAENITMAIMSSKLNDSVSP